MRNESDRQYSNGKRKPEYHSWENMKKRCYNPTYYNHQKYKEKGIIVCDRWLNSFDNFLKDMGYKPTPEHSIDRIDNSGNYEPSNCRWATRSEQQVNKDSYKNKTSKYVGVCWHKKNNKWHTQITINGKQIHLGYFKCDMHAVVHYQKALANIDKYTNPKEFRKLLSL